MDTKTVARTTQLVCTYRRWHRFNRVDAFTAFAYRRRARYRVKSGVHRPLRLRLIISLFFENKNLPVQHRIVLQAML